MAKFMTFDPLAFYCPHVHAGAIPPEAVELSEAEYVRILQGAQDGKVVVASADGRPDLAERDPIEDRRGARKMMRVSRYQLRAALMARGMLDRITRDIDTIGTPEIKLAWADAPEFARLGPVVSFVQSLADMDDDAVDALFAEASRIAA